MSPSPPSFIWPPTIQRMRGKASSARAALAAFVAFESLTNSTPPLSPTTCERCGSPSKLASPASISRGPRPSALSAPQAEAAFWWLCAPGRPRMPRKSTEATCRALRVSARNPFFTETDQPGPPAGRVRLTRITRSSPGPSASWFAM